jgi:murein DD-endopeptidase MepM/ murein hydrolase activator NlpD
MAGVLVAALAVIAFAGSFGNGAARFAWLGETPEVEKPIEPEPVVADDQPETRQVTVESGDTLSEILIEAGADPAEAQAAIAALSSVYDPSTLREGQIISVTFDALDPGPRPETAVPIFPPLLDIVFKPSVEREVFVARSPDGTYGAREVVKALKAIDARARGTIEGSLYLSAKASGIPEAVIIDLIRIYSYDVDFQREVRAGDTFDLLYTNYIDENGEALKSGAIQYAELTLSGTRKPLYRFTTGDDRAPDYFTAKGSSGKRMLMRTPVDGARLTSGFGRRRHPILGYNKMHRGVDFGAASGTPVMAAGNGVIDKASWFGGYGRYVRVRHVNAYSTAYAHLSRYARGIKPGARVRQGQVIGYVGTSGRSTGPHLHYEVLVKAKQINPMGVKLPTGRTLKGQDLAAFQQNIARVTALLDAPAPALVAQGGLAGAAP